MADDDSALARAVTAHGFGINVSPGRPEHLVNSLRDLAANRARLREWGRAGREYVKQFEQRHVLEKFLMELKSLSLEGRAPSRPKL